MKQAIILLIFFLSFTISVFPFEIKSAAFENGGDMPSEYTCDAESLSPPLEWKDSPLNTASFAIICDDPDAPYGTWTHWIVFNIPKETLSLEKNMAQVCKPCSGMLQGLNDFGKIGYGGPCPPQGKAHRYFFQIYALDAIISLKEGATKKDVVEAMSGHIIAETKTVGLYQRKIQKEIPQPPISLPEAEKDNPQIPVPEAEKEIPQVPVDLPGAGN